MTLVEFLSEYASIWVPFIGIVFIGAVTIIVEGAFVIYIFWPLGKRLRRK